MQITTQKYLKRIADVQTWLDAHQTQLTVVPAYAALRARLETQEQAIENAATAQGQSGAQASGTVVVKSQLLDAMRTDIAIIARGARAVALTQPGFDALFPVPSSLGEESVVGAARIFAANLAIPANLSALTNLGMNPNTATELLADSAQFEQLFGAKAAALQARETQLAGLDAAIRASSDTVDTLDAIVHFVFAGDKTALSSWKSAKRLERMTAAQPAPKPPVPPTP